MSDNQKSSKGNDQQRTDNFTSTTQHGRTTDAGDNHREKTKNEIVIARYNEDPFWVLSDPIFESFSKVVYNKGAPLELTPETVPVPFTGPVTIKELPNVGREGHTYLQHIVDNYDCLAPVTVFLPASAMSCDVRNRRAHEIVQRVILTGLSVFYCRLLDKPIDQYFGDFSIDTWVGSNKENAATAQTSTDHSRIARPFREWYAHYFPGVEDVREVSFNGIFAVSREHIRQHDRLYYVALLCALSYSSNPEDGHFLERAWIAVFHPVPRECIVPYEYMDIVLPEQLTESVVMVVQEEQKSAAVKFFEWWASVLTRLLVLRVLLLLLVFPIYYFLKWYYNKTEVTIVEL